MQAVASCSRILLYRLMPSPESPSHDDEDAKQQCQLKGATGASASRIALPIDNLHLLRFLLYLFLESRQFGIKIDDHLAGGFFETLHAVFPKLFAEIDRSGPPFDVARSGSPKQHLSACDVINRRISIMVLVSFFSPETT